MNFIYGALYIFIAIKWGDWRNWRKYYPTILFLIVGDLLYQYLLHDYSMWKYEPLDVDQDWTPNHTLITLLIMAIKYPSTVLVYLSNFPVKKINQLFYVCGWVLFYLANELVTLSFGGITYHHGWNIGWSILFNFVLFIMLYVHHKKPLVAWGVSLIYIIFLWNIFDIPLDVMK